MTVRTRFLVLLVSTPLVAFAVVGGLLGKTLTKDETYQHLRVFEDVVSLMLNNYVEEVDVDRVMSGAMRGLADALDADTSYLTPDEVSLVERNSAPDPGEVGLEITRQYYLRVVSARDGSVAAKAGLRTGDFIRGIDDSPTRDMSVFEGVRRLRGPVGSKVKLTILRGSATEPHEVTLVREAAVTPEVSGRPVADTVGLVRVPAFEAATAQQLAARVKELEQAGVSKLIIDLRGTAQGSFEPAVDAARLFVPAGTLTQRQARDKAIESISAQAGDGAVTLPVELLVTAGTSGPAEVFAAALAGNKRATLIGERTLGRTGLQKLVRFSDGSGLMLTWARYSTPAGKGIHGEGLEPDERVEEPDVEFGEAPPPGDPILDKALEKFGVQKAAA